MSGTSLVTKIVEIIVSAIVPLGKAIGEGLSSLVIAIFISGTGEAAALSVFGTIVIVFASISLGFGLTRWVLNFVTSLGNRNR